jgi:uncharacterized protein (TIGR02246 family)
MSLRMSRPRRSFRIIAAVAALPCLAAAADLQAIADRLEIQDVVGARYAMALDSSDAQAYAALFTEDAFLSVAGRPFQGRKAIVDMVANSKKRLDALDSRPASLAGRRCGPVRHVVTNFVINITGNTATSNSYSTEIGSNGRDEKQHGNPQSIMNVCRYEDSLVKQDGKWLIAKRLITCDMFGKRPGGPDTFPQTMAPSDVSP